MERVVVYIDGLNLYYGMKSMGWRRYYWLDLQRLSENMMNPYQQLQLVRYFTAKVLPDDNAQGQAERQDAYLLALSSLPKLRIKYGFHIPKTITCPHCGAGIRRYEEKMTDVNIAVALLEDAHDDLYDTAILISADSDLIGPVEVVRQKYANKQVIAAFPPKRNSWQLRQAASAAFTLGRKRIAQSQLPNPVHKPDGYPVPKPDNWQ